MFAAAGEIGPEASRASGFCSWTRRLGREARLLIPGITAPARPLVDELGSDGVDVFVAQGPVRQYLSGARLVYLQARDLLASPIAELARECLALARKDEALVAIDLGPSDWIQRHGASRTAYEIAAIRPDILFADPAAAAELGAPLEGLASIPVVRRQDGCSVFGRYVPNPTPDPAAAGAIEAAFCDALLAGKAPVEAAARAVLLAVTGSPAKAAAAPVRAT